ncbi:GTP-binding protein [Neorhodopirellula pilleata]|uniref:Putative GTP-binding protein YjiA n=1 Tax=Neorhodopirellula pilleata TaxID=2714738 RepID=A0A5C6A357_9BACT|nr:GTP-binding protein [Neorhodopirellula pilleata]TWT94344.1 putative GTP-binding protein YjiA [Neorhodopirellula pilleata]
MSEPIHFVMLGGFLGAGKTTLISKLAKRYQADGKHVCVVTNDQAAGLVDTHLLQSQGIEVNEVAGSCFCCNFHGLTDAMTEFETRRRPDVILAEPVGSCTDLMATIAMPLMQRMGEQFTHSPYAVILKPSHGLRILSGSGGGFSAKAEYIFRKQIEEAEVVLINRIDELTSDQVDELAGYLAEQYPAKRIVRVSAKTDENLDEVYSIVQSRSEAPAAMMEVDYDVYAEGEAELGWLNASLTLVATNPYSLDEMTMSLVELIRKALLSKDAEPAHLKVLSSTGGHVSVANLVSSESPAILSMESGESTSQASVIVNARVCMSPDTLRPLVEEVLEQIADRFHAVMTVERIEAFRPGRPVPTYRVTAS